MRNISFVRVDDRLIHGEVITEWLPLTGCNTIIVVDDKSANDPFIKRVLQLSAPKSIQFELYNIENAVQSLQSENNPKERIMILAKSPNVILELLQKGIPFKAVNIGGMGLSEDRKPFYKNLACSVNEAKSMYQIVENYETLIYYQLVPEQKRTDLHSIVKAFLSLQ